MLTANMSYFRQLLVIVLLFAIVGTSAVAASSQKSDNRLAAYIGGGFSDPNGDLAAGAELGFGAMTHFSYRITPRVEAILGAEYHSFSLDISRIPGITGGRFWAFLLGGGVKIDPGRQGSEISPFLSAGGGMALIDFTDTLKGFTGLGTIVADSDIKPFVEFSGGFEFNKVFAIVKFANVILNESDVRFISFGLGVKLNLL